MRDHFESTAHIHVALYNWLVINISFIEADLNQRVRGGWNFVAVRIFNAKTTDVFRFRAVRKPSGGNGHLAIDGIRVSHTDLNSCKIFFSQMLLIFTQLFCDDCTNYISCVFLALFRPVWWSRWFKWSRNTRFKSSNVQYT